jgi:phage shock protein PspC (stress-responsive transcriptional regulator)
MPKDPRSGAATLGGLALIVIGLAWLVRATGIIPAAVFDTLASAVPALIVVGLGVVILYFSRSATFKMPAPGTRLYRSRSDRWIGGVLGGLGAYLGIDPVLLRIATVLLTVLGAGSLVIAYIVMYVVVPEEPLAPAGSYVPPVTPPAPPVPPAPSADGS